MRHSANMSVRDSLACGLRVSQSSMSQDDIDFVKSHDCFVYDKGQWFNSNLNTKRDRDFRDSMWNPDTGPWRKGVNY